jgi:hypothetical protein
MSAPGRIILSCISNVIIGAWMYLVERRIVVPLLLDDKADVDAKDSSGKKIKKKKNSAVPVT